MSEGRYKCKDCSYYSEGEFSLGKFKYCIGSPELDDTHHVVEIDKIYIENGETWYFPEPEDDCVIKYGEGLTGHSKDIR